jgi:hypothetical protein
MRLLLVVSITGAMAACTRGGSTGHDAANASDVGASMDGGVDAVAMSCTIDADCDDHVACTIDQCVIGNVCMHTPINGMCPSGQHCGPSGCTSATTCNVDADCDDHVYCNGMEACLLHTCTHGTAVDCSTGDPCHVGSCDETMMMCTAMTVCDSGAGSDAGPMCTTFHAPSDFNGSFLLAPSQNQGCGITMYTISSIAITVTASGISVTGLSVDNASQTMTGPAPSGNSFTATYTDHCGTYTLTGTFGSCRESFAGHWSATFTCGCTPMSASVTGLRT